MITDGYIVVSPAGHILHETFRLSSAASKACVTGVPTDGKLRTWNWFRQHHWKCKKVKVSFIDAAIDADMAGGGK